MTRKRKRPTECEKLLAVRNESQTIGAFLDWLQNERGLLICRVKEDDFVPTHFSIETLLAQYFDINLAEAEREKRQILRDFQRRTK